MNAKRCKVALAEMAAVCPRRVSGALANLAFAVDTDGKHVSAQVMTGALRNLREAGVSVEKFVAAFAEEEAVKAE